MVAALGTVFSDNDDKIARNRRGVVKLHNLVHTVPVVNCRSAP